MNYRLLFEKPGDISRDCPFLPDDEEYEMHLSAVIGDINGIDGVLDVKQHSDGAVIVVTDGMSKDIFKEKLAPFLSEHFCCLRLPSENVEVVQG